MNRILLVLAGLILYFAVMAIYANYVGGRRKTDKLGRKVNRTHSELKALPDRQRKRVEKSLLILEKHPDLRNGIGALVSTRYADQIATIAERYARVRGGSAAGHEDQLLQGLSMTEIITTRPEVEPDEASILLDEGIGTIERKIRKALEAKGAEARDELDIYVRFLREAD